MNYKTGLIFIALTFSLIFHLSAQVTTKNDSLAVCKTVNNFFAWYIDAIKQGNQSAFQPIFVESKSGMTTLNFNEYIANLIKCNFSDSLINKEKSSYQKCIAILETVKYADFKSKFTDLDDFENANCDFCNYFRWTGGQEPIDGVKIIEVQFKDSSSSIIILKYFNYNLEEKRNDYWGRNVVSLIKTNNNWKIDSIDWR